jgi:hypothetical protein
LFDYFLKIIRDILNIFKTKVNMIILNGKKFAKNKKEFTESLFNTGGTCVGYYKINKKTISLLDPQKNKIGVITYKRVLANVIKLENGKYWYSYDDINLIGKYESLVQENNELTAICMKYFPGLNPYFS